MGHRSSRHEKRRVGHRSHWHGRSSGSPVVLEEVREEEGGENGEEQEEEEDEQEEEQRGWEDAVFLVLQTKSPRLAPSE